MKEWISTYDLSQTGATDRYALVRNRTTEKNLLATNIDRFAFKDV